MSKHHKPFKLKGNMTLRQKMINIRSFHFQMEVCQMQQDGCGDLTMPEFRFCWMMANKAVTRWHIQEMSRIAYANLRGGLVQELANRGG
jgi:hypothetical protein